MIVATALDNAIEGIARSHDVEKKITLIVASKDNFIDVLVENFAAGPIDADFRTTKPDKANHGFGLAHIRAVVKKHAGVVEPSYDSENGKFTLRAILRNVQV